MRLRATGNLVDEDLTRLVQENHTEAILEWLEQHPGAESYQQVLKRCDPHVAKLVDMKMREATILQDLSTLSLLMRASVAIADEAMQRRLLEAFEDPCLATSPVGCEQFLGHALKCLAQRGDVAAAARLLDLAAERRLPPDVAQFNRALQAAAACLASRV